MSYKPFKSGFIPSLLLLLVGTAILLGCELQQGSTGGVALPQVVVKGLPADLSSVFIKVSGPGMSDLVRTVTPDSASAVLEVPPGIDRRFEIFAYVGALGSVPAYVGEATVDAGNDAVSVISGATDSVVTNIAVGLTPYGAAVNPKTNRVYAANKGDNTVSVIDGATNKVLTTVPVGTEPLGVAVNPYTNRVYVANSRSSGVSVIDGATSTVITTVTVGSQPSYPGILP